MNHTITKDYDAIASWYDKHRSRQLNESKYLDDIIIILARIILARSWGFLQDKPLNLQFVKTTTIKCKNSSDQKNLHEAKAKMICMKFKTKKKMDIQKK